MRTLTSSSSGGECRNPSFGLTTKVKGLQGCELRESPRVTSHTPGSVRKCEGVWGSEPSHSQGNSHFGRQSPDGLPKLQKAISGVKTQWPMAFFISLKSSWNIYVWNGLALLIWTSKTQVMAKKRSGIKLSIWLLTKKSQESTQFTCL